LQHHSTYYAANASKARADVELPPLFLSNKQQDESPRWKQPVRKLVAFEFVFAVAGLTG
jgi:hypothetical protein